MKSLIPFAFVIGNFISPVSGASAQTPDTVSSVSRFIRLPATGATIRARLINGDSLTGTLQTTSDGTVMIGVRPGRLIAVDSLESIDTRTERLSNRKKGTMIGAVIFGVAGILAGKQVSPSDMMCFDGDCSGDYVVDGRPAMLLGLFGASIGGLIGSQVKTRKWETFSRAVTIQSSKRSGVTLGASVHSQRRAELPAPGARVRIHTIDGRIATGTVDSGASDTMTFRSRTCSDPLALRPAPRLRCPLQARLLPEDSILRLDVSSSHHSRILPFAATGGIVGATFGYIGGTFLQLFMGAFCYSKQECDALRTVKWASTLLFGGFGGLTGGIVGSFVPADHWRPWQLGSGLSTPVRH